MASVLTFDATAGRRRDPASPRHAAAPTRTLPAEERVGARTWIAVLGALLGAFMAVLNIQITNASLPDIQGGIGTGIDEGGWISTAYLIGEIVVIPLGAFLSQVFSVRRYLITSAALFLVFSAACAFARNLGQMIFLRGLQGFAGGVLIPMAFTIVVTMLPRSRQPLGLALFALTATFAPAIGPTIGGYLTETYGWQYIFYLNLVPGVIMLAALVYALEPRPMQLHLLKTGDWSGIATMAIGLAALQTVLEEGNKDDWFGSPLIVRLSVVAALFLGLFLAIECRTKAPLINLRLLGRRNFGLGTLANTLLGVALYGSVYALPLYLSETQGYNAEQIGAVMAWTGLPQLVLIPLVPSLMKRIDPRLITCAGLAVFAASFFLNTHMSASYGGDQFFIPNLVRAIGQALVMTPLAVIATAGIEPRNAGSASALFNMMRNVGGAFGTALLETFLTHREQFHSNVINSHVSLINPATTQRIQTLQGYFLSHGVADPAQARNRAIAEIGRTIHAQATIMSFSDGFLLLAAMVATAGVAAALLRKAPPGGGGGAH
jgi:DHA2 family multidrug resistance protein